MSQSMLDIAYDYAPGELHVKRRVAEVRLRALSELDAAQPLRDELAEAGVSGERIAALYPFDFGDYIDAIIPLISGKNISQLTTPEAMEEGIAIIERLTQLTAELGKAALRRQNSVVGFDRKMAALAEEIESYLPPELERRRFEVSQMLTIMLWHAMTLTSVEGSILISPEVQFMLYRFFLQLTDLLLPHLREAETALIAQVATLHTADDAGDAQ